MPSKGRVSDSGDVAGLAEALEGLDPGTQKTKSRKKEWHPFSMSDLTQPGCFSGVIFFADQTISKTGCGLLRLKSRIDVTNTWTLVTRPTGLKGYADYEQRADELAHELAVIFDRYTIDLIAHETAPMGGRLRSPESSLAAAMVLHGVAACSNIPVISLDNKHVRHVLTGNQFAEKSEVKKRIEDLFIDAKDWRPWNQDISDGLAVGLVAAKEHKA